MKRISLVPTIVIGSLGILAGIMFAFLANVALTVVCIICGILTLLAGVPQLATAIQELVNKNKMAIIDLIFSVVTIAVGIMLILSRNEIIMMVVGAYLIVFPLIRILIAPDKANQIKSELPAIILGIALVLIGPGAALDLLFRIAGAVVIVLSVLYIVFGIVNYVKIKNAINNCDGKKTYVDTDGNGTPDTVYVDIDGDGQGDVEIKIDEEK